MKHRTWLRFPQLMRRWPKRYHIRQIHQGDNNVLRIVKYVYKKRVPFQRNAPLPEEKLPAEKLSGISGVKSLDSQAIKVIFDNVTQPPSTENPSKPTPSFLKLIAEMSQLSLPGAAGETKEGLVGGVEHFLTLLKSDNSPIVPRVDLINKSLQALLEAGQPGKVLAIVDEMRRQFGINPNHKTHEILAMAYLRTGKVSKALERVRDIEVLTENGYLVYNRAIQGLFRLDKDTEAWSLFNELRAKGLPSPTVCATMINRCGKLDTVEKAFLLHKELTLQGLTANPECSAALIYAASKRKEYFSMAFDLFRQMELLNMKIDLPVYDNLLYACSKAADLGTAMSLWRTLITSPDPRLKPSICTCTNYLWALASAESLHTKISKREFYYKGIEKLSQSAIEVFEFVKSNGLPINAYFMSSILAVLSNNKNVKEAEDIFWNEYKAHGILRNPFCYELMYKLYDNVKNYDGANKVYQEWKGTDIKIPYEGWRALIRTAALCDRLEESINHIKEMVQQGYTPSRSDLSHVRLRLIEREREDLLKNFYELCKEDRPRTSNPFVPWLARSNSVGDLLKQSYGKKAPEVASKIAR